MNLFQKNMGAFRNAWSVRLLLSKVDANLTEYDWFEDWNVIRYWYGSKFW